MLLGQRPSKRLQVFDERASLRDQRRVLQPLGPFRKLLIPFLTFQERIIGTRAVERVPKLGRGTVRGQTLRDGDKTLHKLVRRCRVRADRLRHVPHEFQIGVHLPLVSLAQLPQPRPGSGSGRRNEPIPHLARLESFGLFWFEWPKRHWGVFVEFLVRGLRPETFAIDQLYREVSKSPRLFPEQSYPNRAEEPRIDWLQNRIACRSGSVVCW